MPHISEAPVLQINRFYTGLYTFRNPLVVPVKMMGRRLIELYDAISAGQNLEITNTLTLKRRPGYTSYNTGLIAGVPEAFYSFKPSSFPGQVFPIVDTTTNVLYVPPGTTIPTSLIAKPTSDQTNYCGIGPYLYMGNPQFSKKWDAPSGPQGITNWGIAIGSVSNATGPNGCGTGTDVPAGTAWANPGNITANDGSFATCTPSPGVSSPTQSPSSGANSGGGTAWTNPNGITVPDGSGANCVLPHPANSQLLQATGYGFSIPGTATIVGIVVKALVSVSAGTDVSDATVKLLKAGTPVGSNLGNGNPWGSTFAYQTYGGSGNLWGTTWTPADINNANFGVEISAFNSSLSTTRTAHIDYISIQVFYTTAGAPAVSDYLEGTNFGFGIPATTTISGIQVDVKGLQTQTAGTYLAATLLKTGGNLTGTTKTGTMLPASNAFVTYGGPGDLWGTTWTPNDVNDVGFGVALQAYNATGSPVSWSVDFVQITIYGVGGPTVTLVAGSLVAQTGYQYQFCYGNASSGHVSSPSPPSSVIIPATNGVQVSLTASTDPQVNQIRVFRTTDGGGQPFFELPTSPYPNTTQNIVDNAPDNTLQIKNICPLPLFNNPPPAGLVDPVWFSGRLWGHVGNLLYFSSGPDITMGNQPEAWFPVYQFALPTTIIRKFPLPNGMLVVTVDDIFVVRGIDTTSFTVNEFMRDIGMRNWNAGDSDGSNVYLYTTDRQMLLLNANGLQSISGAISDVIASVDPSAAYVSTFRFTARNTMLFLGDGTTNIYPYNLNQQAWCPVQVPNGGVRAIGSIETQPGIYNFLRGKTSTNQTIAQRNIMTFSDEGTNYACNVIFGPIPFADAMTLAQIGNIVASYAAGQSTPSLSVLANEITGAFQGLTVSSTEPPELSATPSQSFMSNRYSWKSTTLPEFLNFMQLQFSWPAAATADELYLWAIGGTQTTGGSSLGQPGQLPQLQGR